jgi:hypothetical protein
LSSREGVEEGLGLVPPMAEQLEGRHALLIATHDHAVDQARSHLEVVHGLDDEGVAARPVVAVAGDEPDPRGSRRAISRKPSCLIS